MDSATQFVLGACVGTAVLGRRLGVRKAAITGGLLGTLPDMDVFWPNGDPVDSFVTHRSATHSLLVQTLVTPLLGEGLRRLFAGLRDHRALAYLAVFLCLTTHALLDSLTIYGTQLFWPLWKEPLGLGSIFIIDPLYTLPLLVMVLRALFQRDWSRSYGKGLTAAVVLSSGYLLWSATAQAWALDLGKRHLAKLGVEPDQMMATPVPFSTLFWRIIAVDRTHDYSVYVPLLGGAGTLTAYSNRRIPENLTCWLEENLQADTALRTLADFADGYFRLDIVEGQIRFADLRMGLSGTYAFQFTIARLDQHAITPTPAVRVESVRQLPQDRVWLKDGILGKRTVRNFEQANLITTEVPRLIAQHPASSRSC